MKTKANVPVSLYCEASKETIIHFAFKWEWVRIAFTAAGASKIVRIYSASKLCLVKYLLKQYYRAYSEWLRCIAGLTAVNTPSFQWSYIDDKGRKMSLNWLAVQYNMSEPTGLPPRPMYMLAHITATFPRQLSSDSISDIDFTIRWGAL